MTRGNFKKKIDEIFWDSYAKVYDDMDKYYKSYKSLIDEIANFIDDNIKRKDRVLDAGCGTGTLSIKLIEKGFPVNAIDISETMLAVFKKKIKDKNTKNLEIKNGDLNKKLPYKNKFFDAIVNIHSLFMLDDIFFTIKEFDRVLKPKGYLIIVHPKPMKVSVVGKLIKDEGLIKGFWTFFRLIRIIFFNIILKILYKYVYGEVPTERIIDFLKQKEYKLIFQRSVYNNIDSMIALKK